MRQINHTFISLIPKCDNVKSTNHFRPISLCSTVYEIISKIITTRLKKVIGVITHPLQGAFMANQAIRDNITIAHEIFHSYRSDGQGGVVCNQTMEKTYDIVDCEFMWAILKKFGFYYIFVGWLKECVETVSFSVLINNGST